MNLNEWTLNQAAGLLNEEFEPLGSKENYTNEEIKKRIKQQQMLHEDVDSDNSFDDIFKTLSETRDLWLKELQETLPSNYHATAYTGSCACGLSKKIPGINITRDNDTKPGTITLVNNTNPRKIEFEGVEACTTNGWEKNVAIHYPGVRRMATRFTLPGMYNYKKTVANIVKDMIG